ncbi:MAG: CBS domain-containing protein [Anaerolineales bacterium]|jgi:CBS domain-containing protein|nr:CBS domain-containing protein [Anaerolineales bacterium]
MKRNVVSIREDASIAAAARECIDRHVGVLPVLNARDIPIGIVTLPDLMKLELPDFVSLVREADFVHDFGAVETTRPDPASLTQPITQLMKPILTIEPKCGLLRAYSLMIQHNLNDLVVTQPDGQLAGLVSRVDIGTAILSSWFEADHSR